MLVLLSDLHLSDDSTATNVDPSAFDLFANAVLSTARSRSATEIHVVLLGDIFDLVRTSYWLRNNIPMSDRPWGGDLDAATGMNSKPATSEPQFAAILELILQTKSSLAFVAAILKLRQNTQNLKVTYVVGNHDRVLNNFSSLRARISTAIPGIQFTSVLHQESEYGLLARHGHEWDDNCHGWKFRRQVLVPKEKPGRFDQESYLVMAIGEVVTAELMGGLIFNAEQELAQLAADPNDAIFLRNLRDVNNLRPLTEALSWIGWFTRGHSERFIEPVRKALCTSLDTLLASSLARKWDKLAVDFLVAGDLTDYLSKARGLLDESNGLRRLASVVSTIGGISREASGLLGSGLDKLSHGAREEFNGKLAIGTQFIAYGHSHEPLHHYFHAGAEGEVQMYVNTGTYLPIVERTRDGTSFARTNQMTVAYFFKISEATASDSATGPSMDVWNGIRRRSGN